jgi:hypothetical protein
VSAPGPIEIQILLKKGVLHTHCTVHTGIVSANGII